MHVRYLAILATIAFTVSNPVALRAQGTVQTLPIDPFGQEVTLTGKTIVYLSGTGEWDNAYETLKAAFKSIQDYLQKRGAKPAGPAMTIYTAMDDMTFNFRAAMPVAEAPKGPPQANIAIGTSPTGKVIKFVHRGSFDALTGTYDVIAHHVDEKQISTQELLIEEYVADFLTTPADKLVINIFVPLN